MEELIFFHFFNVTNYEKTTKPKSSLRTQNSRSFILVFIVAVTRLRGKSVAQIIIFVRNVVAMMNGNPNFVDPQPTLADLTMAIDALAAAEQAMDGSRAKTIVRNARLKEVKFMLSEELTYVNLISRGNAEVGVTSGFDIRDAKSVVGLLAHPELFVAYTTTVEGQVKLKWNSVKKRSSYIIEYALNPGPDAVKGNVECTKANTILNGLTSGALFYFRIATISTGGNGASVLGLPAVLNKLN
ncbi:MAG: DUF4398 domain-containing protein [Bacteroidetes bacterium]|nr:DUF4398 domain-containing protein [Bacteroidota bacterium]